MVAGEHGHAQQRRVAQPVLAGEVLVHQVGHLGHDAAAVRDRERLVVPALEHGAVGHALLRRVGETVCERSGVNKQDIVVALGGRAGPDVCTLVAAALQEGEVADQHLLVQRLAEGGRRQVGHAVQVGDVHAAMVQQRVRGRLAHVHREQQNVQ